MTKKPTIRSIDNPDFDLEPYPDLKQGVDRSLVSYSTDLGSPPTDEERVAMRAHYARHTRCEVVDVIDSSCQVTAEEMALLPDDFVDIDFIDRVYRERLAEKHAHFRDIAKDAEWDAPWRVEERRKQFCIMWMQESATEGQTLKSNPL